MRELFNFKRSPSIFDCLRVSPHRFYDSENGCKQILLYQILLFLLISLSFIYQPILNALFQVLCYYTVRDTKINVIITLEFYCSKYMEEKRKEINKRNKMQNSLTVFYLSSSMWCILTHYVWFNVFNPHHLFIICITTICLILELKQ